MKVLHCGNTDFRHFCSYDLEIDPINFIYELHPYFLMIYMMCEYELPTSRLGIRKLSSDRQTYRQTEPELYTTALRGWSEDEMLNHVVSESGENLRSHSPQPDSTC